MYDDNEDDPYADLYRIEVSDQKYIDWLRKNYPNNTIFTG